jgi:hypothetical protein
MWWRGGIDQRSLDLDISGLLYDPADLPPISLEKELHGPRIDMEELGKRKFVSLHGLELRLLRHSATPTELPWLLRSETESSFSIHYII